MLNTRLVSAINNGIVIDHILAGQALKIMRWLPVMSDTLRVTLGLNLESKRLKLKDLIKIENRTLTAEEIQKIAVFSPKATINSIREFVVCEKIKCDLPSTIRDILLCPNVNCISHCEAKSHFNLAVRHKEVMLFCSYCEKQFKRDQVQEVSL